MATIKPFRALRPNPLYVGKLVFTAPQVESVAWETYATGKSASLKEQLENAARVRPETQAGQQLAYSAIKQTLNNLIESAQLYRELRAGIYVYEIAMSGYRQIGIWALTDLNDYIQGKIKTHEQTLTDSVRRICNYREHTGLEGNPILLTYSPSMSINRIIAQTIKNDNKVTLSSRDGSHSIWKIEDKSIQRQLIKAFAAIKTVYLADGHHRLSAAAKLLVAQREENAPVFDTISSLYIATDQLRLQEYDRAVLLESPFQKEMLFEKLSTHFSIEPSNSKTPVQPRRAHRIGMYAFQQWFYLTPRKTIAGNSVAATIDASILQEQLLKPIFGITNPQTDPRLKCLGGEKAPKEIIQLINAYPEVIIFTLYPLEITQLVTVAEAGEILPPKSTWIDPKVPYGLLMQWHKPV
jgi:uncharacterized protein (DUF1015 family)